MGSRSNAVAGVGVRLYEGNEISYAYEYYMYGLHEIFSSASRVRGIFGARVERLKWDGEERIKAFSLCTDYGGCSTLGTGTCCWLP